MKKHNGMRPQDLLILLKIASINTKNWLAKDLAYSLKISQSEVSESLNRSSIAGFINTENKVLFKNSLLEFLQYGLKYVFPQKPGAIVRGIPTAHSAPPLNKLIEHTELFVWPYEKGIARGQSIEPFYYTVPEVAAQDEKLYELLALSDVLRIGRAREQKLAAAELKKRIFNEK